MGDDNQEKSPKRSPTARPKRAQPITLPLLSEGRRPTVGCLAFSQRYAKPSSRWSDLDLSFALEQVRAQRALDVDLVLCSGIKIFAGGFKESDRAIAQRITAAAGGRPVLLEWPDAGSEDEKEWWLAHGDEWTIVRRDQYVTSAVELGAGGKRVLEEIQDGYGVIKIGDSTTLVLLICNEGRLLSRDPRTSAIAPGVTRPKTGIPAVMNQPWSVLHPSHRPHHFQTVRRGWHLLGPTKNNASGIFQDATAHSGRGNDGTCAPTTVLHAGPWEPGYTWQMHASVSKFHGGAMLSDPSTTHIPGLVEIRYAEFEV